MLQKLNRGEELNSPAIKFKTKDSVPKTFFSLVFELEPSKILLEFYSTRIVVGRSSGVDFCLPSLCVSRRHCILDWSEDGWNLRDLDSKNGTFVNGFRITSKKLRPFDEIQIGIFSLVVKKADPDFQLHNAIQTYKRAG